MDYYLYDNSKTDMHPQKIECRKRIRRMNIWNIEHGCTVTFTRDNKLYQDDEDVPDILYESYSFPTKSLLSQEQVIFRLSKERWYEYLGKFVVYTEDGQTIQTDYPYYDNNIRFVFSVKALRGD